MTILFLSIFFTTVIVLGLTIFTQEGMAGYSLRESAINMNNKLMKVVILCEWCMPTLWSLAGYFFAFLMCGFELKALLFYPITICATSVLVGGIWGILALINKNSQ